MFNELMKKIDSPVTEIAMDGGKGKGTEKPREATEEDNSREQHTTGNPKEKPTRRDGDTKSNGESMEQKPAGV